MRSQQSHFDCSVLDGFLQIVRLENISHRITRGLITTQPDAMGLVVTMAKQQDQNVLFLCSCEDALFSHLPNYLYSEADRIPTDGRMVASQCLIEDVGVQYLLTVLVRIAMKVPSIICDQGQEVQAVGPCLMLGYSVEQMPKCKKVADEPSFRSGMCIFVQDAADSDDAGLCGDVWGCRRVELFVHCFLFGWGFEVFTRSFRLLEG